MTPIRVLEKAGDVLALLAANGPRRAQDISNELGEPRSSIYRLLKSMSELDYIEQGERRGEYHVGMKLLRLGGAVSRRFSVRQAALPAIEHLHEETGHTIFLFVKAEDQAVCIERIDGTMVRLVVVDIGGSLPLHAGAGPPVLLAWSSEREITEHLESARLEPYTPKSPVTPRAVRDTLEGIRERGWALSDEDIVSGITTLGAPIRDHHGNVVASVSMAGASATVRAEQARLLTELLEAAASASRRLGYNDEHGQPSRGLPEAHAETR